MCLQSIIVHTVSRIIKNVVYEVMQEQESANDERLDLISDIIADLQSKQNILLDKIFFFFFTNLIKNIVYQTVKEQGFVDKEKIDLISDVIADLKSKQDIQISKIKNRVTALEDKQQYNTTRSRR